LLTSVRDISRINSIGYSDRGLLNCIRYL
jgi:hypothetical protein